MVFTVAQTTAFLEEAAQMGLSHRTRVQLQVDGVNDTSDLAEWTDDDWDQFATNCKRPDRIPDAAGVLIHQAPFVIPVRSLRRLKVASHIARYYEATSRTMSAPNMQWNSVLLNFDILRTVLMRAAKEDEPNIPKLSVNTSVPKWADSFKVAISQRFGARKSNLSYVIRADAAVPNAAPALAAGQPHATEYGSIEAEMTARLSHTHTLFS